MLRKAEDDSSPVWLVCMGQSEQAAHLIGLVSFNDAFVNVHVPSGVVALFSIDDCEDEYSDPREARPSDRARSQRLLDHTQLHDRPMAIYGSGMEAARDSIGFPILRHSY